MIAWVASVQNLMTTRVFLTFNRMSQALVGTTGILIKLKKITGWRKDPLIQTITEGHRVKAKETIITMAGEAAAAEITGV